MKYNKLAKKIVDRVKIARYFHKKLKKRESDYLNFMAGLEDRKNDKS